MASASTREQSLMVQLREEANEAADQATQALASLSWLWPIRGIVFSATHPQIILSVKEALLKSLVTSSIAFILLAVFTFIPQAAFLSLFTGFLGPFLAIILVGAECLVLLTFFTRALFLEPALDHVFDSTLHACGQHELVQKGKVKIFATKSKSGVQEAFIRPFQALSRDGLIKYLVTLPLNLIPGLGTVAFLILNGQRGGPGWHSRYHQLKGLTKQQRIQSIRERQPEYTAFGMAALLLNTIPLVGLIFTFTSTVGAAMWAADIEARANLIEGNQSRAKTE